MTGGTGPSAPSAALPRKNSPSTGPSHALPRKSSPSAAPPAVFSRKSSPSTGLPSAYPRRSSPSAPENSVFRPFWACRANFFALTHRSGRAGRIISRTGHSHVATLKPMTPLQPLMRANAKPPSPLLASEQRPLKPTTPLQPQNARKTPISHPQRRRRFQPHTRTSEQRRHSFQATAHLVCAHRLRHQQASMRPLPTKTRMQFDWMKFQRSLKTLQFQRCEFNV